MAQFKIASGLLIACSFVSTLMADPVQVSNSGGSSTLPHPVKNPSTYVGRLQCESLELHLSQLKDSLPRAFCQEALRGCLSLHQLDQLPPDDPMRLEMEEALEDKVALDINICELSIRHNDPEFYEKNLKRH